MRVLVLGERSEPFVALLREREVDALAVEEPAADALAAGCLLVAPRAEPTNGLEPGIDHVSAGTDGELADLAAVAAKFPAAFEPVVAMGRVKAQARGITA